MRKMRFYILKSDLTNLNLYQWQIQKIHWGGGRKSIGGGEKERDNNMWPKANSV